LTGDRMLPDDLGDRLLPDADGDHLLPDAVRDLDAPRTDAARTSRPAILRFASDENGRTFVERQFAPYPFHFCRPFYLPGDPEGMATLYSQSCAGGIFEHDALELHIEAATGAKVHVTTSASTIVHGMPDGSALQKVCLVAAEGALLEYLPDPMILFAGSRAQSRVELNLQADAQVMISDAFLLHDYRARGGAFDWFHGDITVRDRIGRIVMRDRIRVNGNDLLGITPGLMNGCVAQASVMLFCRHDRQAAVLEMWCDALNRGVGIYAGASSLGNDLGIFARIIANDGAALRQAQLALWHCARLQLTGRPPTIRRK
jgi:urease accessory protein